MLAGLFVVVFVEFANELFEDGAHGVVVDAGGLAGGGGREVDVGIEELADEGAEGVGFGEGGELVAEFEIFDDVLNVGGEAVEVVFEVGEELVLGGAGFEVAEGEAGGVVEDLAGGGGESGVLFGDAGLVEEGFGFEDLGFGGFEDGVHAADDAHGEDDVGVLAAFEEVAEDVVGNAPDEGDDFVVGGLVHYFLGVGWGGPEAGGWLLAGWGHVCSSELADALVANRFRGHPTPSPRGPSAS